MSNFLRLFYLKSVTLHTRDIPRLRFVLNLAIFLSIFAVTASLITIYYEKKIDKIEKFLLDTQLDIQVREVSLETIIYQITTGSLKFVPLKNQYQTNSYYRWTDANILRDRDIYFRNFENYYPYIKQDFYFMNAMIELAKFSDLNPKKFKKYEVSEKETQFKKILDEVLHDIETLTVDGVFDPDIDQYFLKYRGYLEFLFQIHNDVQIFLVDGYGAVKKIDNIERKRILSITKEISNLSDVSVKVIFLAFLIQIAIFFIIQYFEIAAAKREREK